MSNKDVRKHFCCVLTMCFFRDYYYIVKKLFQIITFLFSSLFFLFYLFPAYADSLCPSGGSGFEGLCSLKLDQAGGVVGKIVTILLTLAIILALFFLIWGGIRWIMSGGD